ncbi:MAG: glycosyltransferase family 4 protein, partial [Gaiellaceae bacterium]
AAGVELILVVPRSWPDAGSERALSAEPFELIELDVTRAGDVNRHAYPDSQALERLLREHEPDLVDIHEEPFSLAARQWLAATLPGVPVAMYTAQNVDKRLPPPFAGYERQAHRRVAALYPCSRQAAAVARGKGFDGLIEVVPLGFDPDLFFSGTQSLGDEVVTLALLGRLVPEKGVLDAVRVLAGLNADRPARLLLVGSGPEERPAIELAEALGVRDRVEMRAWGSAADVGETCRSAHVLLVPSTPTTTWTEQFGRVIVEAQASGAVVAGYATGSIPEVGGDAAVLVDPGDVAGLAAAVRALARDPADHAERRERGLRLSRTRTWASVAARHATLYERVADGALDRQELERSPRRRRAAARAEFGETAPTTAGRRPFALPLLRAGGPISAVLAPVIDAGAEAKAHLSVGQRPSSTRS